MLSRYLPSSKSTAEVNAPFHIDLHAIVPSGRNRNISPKRTELRPMDKAMLTTWNNTSSRSGTKGSTHLLKAVRTEVRMRETSMRNTSESTIPTENSRSFKNLTHCLCGFGC